MNKQIEEMAKVIYASDILCHTCGESTYTYCADAIAELLYSAGYRKASDVAREIFEEIDNAYEDCFIILGDMGYFQLTKFVQKIAELKKKREVEE